MNRLADLMNPKRSSNVLHSSINLYSALHQAPALTSSAAAVDLETQLNNFEDLPPTLSPMVGRLHNEGTKIGVQGLEKAPRSGFQDTPAAM